MTLEAFIPPARGYIPREISPGVTDAQFLDQVWSINQSDGYCAGCSALRHEGQPCPTRRCKGAYVPHRTKTNVALVGPTGSGKTSGLVDFAARHRLPMFTISFMTSAHAAFGQFVPDADTGGLRWVKGPVWMIAEHGGILYWDEINFLDPQVQSSFFGVLDFRRSLDLMEHPVKAVCDDHGYLERIIDPISGIDHRHCAGFAPWEGPLSIKLNPKTLVVATYNPAGEYAGTNQLNAAMSNRFVTLRYPYDTEVEERLITCPAIRALGTALRQLSDRIQTPVSTNRLLDFERMILVTQDYSLAKVLFLGNFSDWEIPVVRSLIEDIYEVNGDLEGGGILPFFNIDAETDEYLEN